MEESLVMNKVLFLGSKPIGFNCLKYLIDYQEELRIEIVGVLSNDNPVFGTEFSVKKLANKYGIQFIKGLDDIVDIKYVDFIISIQYHQILKTKHIEVANKLAINLHMAPLPEYRGCNQFSFAIYNKSKIFGTTIHRLESGIDNGDIIVERRFEIDVNEDVKSLYDKTYEASIRLFKENISDILSLNYNVLKQANLLDTRETHYYTRNDINKLKQIDLNQSEEEIILRIKATAMPGFEQPFTIVDGEKYYIIPEKNLKK
jgi:methionyl-tRNA formyltransferase